MKRLFILFLLLSGSAFGSNTVYISHAGAGSANGTSCSNAEPYSYFNSSANWSSSPTGVQIGPGTTVHGCSETWNDASAGDVALTFQCATANGTSSNPITLSFDQGATNLYNGSYWNASGAIENTGSCTYVVLNGDNNLTISNQSSGGSPTNGSGLANEQTSVGIEFDGCTQCTIENTTVKNIYINAGSSSGATDVNGANTIGITITGPGTGSIISGNTVSSSRGNIELQPDPNADITGAQIINNTISDDGWAIVVGGGDCGDTGTGIIIAGNNITNWTNWQFPTSSYHQDGIFVFNNCTTAAVFTGSIYDNYVYGNLGAGSPTGYVYVAENTSFNIFNNLIVETGSTVGQPGMFWIGSANNDAWSGGHNIYNNTMVANKSGDTCVTFATTFWHHQAYSLGFIITDSNGREEKVTTAGTSGTSAPSWPSSSGITTNDGGTLVWTSQAKNQSVIQNNVFVGCTIGFNDYYNGVELSTINRNVWSGSPTMALLNGADFWTYSQWLSNTTFDVNSATTNPSLTGSYLIPSTSSSAYQLGQAWSGAPTAWLTGAPATFGAGGSCGSDCLTRPSSGAVDAGAYPFASGGGTAPTVTTTTATSVTTTTASAGGTVTSNGGASVTSEGTCYATTANPIAPCTSDGTATPFTSSLTGLTASTLYHYRAFATNSVGTSYGADQTFTTNCSTCSLTINVPNAGASVSSSPSGISSCTAAGGTCTANFATGTSITLTTTISGSNYFGSWGGQNCSGTSATCTFSITANVSETSSAYPQQPGTVTSTLSAYHNDDYCPIYNGPPYWASNDSYAQMPLNCYNTNINNTPAPGTVVNVSTAAQLTSALAAAACGQQITLQAGATFSGSFTIPSLVCTDSNYLWIVSSGLASLPAQGARYTTTQWGSTVYAPQFGPCYSGVTNTLGGRPQFFCPGTPGTYTAKVISPNTTAAFTGVAGLSHVRFSGLEVTRTPGTGINYALFDIGNKGNIDHIILDRIYCHGDENQDETETCVSNSAVSYLAIIDSYMPDFVCVATVGACTDSHPIFGGVNSTNSVQEVGLKVVNNYLEGAGETYISGGGTAYTTPADVEYRLNLNVHPLQWNPGDPSYNGGIPGTGGHANAAYSIVVKNLFETKNVARLFNEANQYFNNWGGFTQEGECWKLLATNQANGSSNDCNGTYTACGVTDVTMRYNTCSTVNYFAGISMTGNSNGALPQYERNISVHDDVIDNMGYPTCSNCPATNSTMSIDEGSNVASATQAINHVNISHTTLVSANGAALQVGLLGMGGPCTIGSSTCTPVVSLAYQANNIQFENNAALIQTNGTQFEAGNGAVNCAYQQTKGLNVINACWNGYTMAGNCLIGNGSVTWPSGSITSVTTQSAAYTSWNNGENGNYVIASGACKGAGSDGLDPGANISLVANVLAGLTFPVAPPAPAAAFF